MPSDLAEPLYPPHADASAGREGEPYGPRSLGATTDSSGHSMGSAATASASGPAPLSVAPPGPVQLRSAAGDDRRSVADPITASVGATAPQVGGSSAWSMNGAGSLVVQRKDEADAAMGADAEGAAGLGSEASVAAAAAHGTSGPAGALPHRDTIQAAFGRHDVSGVQAHEGAAATEGAAALGAEAYATGEKIAFAGTPSLHTAAHEAAHVVQQRAGVHLKGGVGEVGDAYEQHADAVADRVVAGDSAEGLLDSMAGSRGAAPALQRTPLTDLKTLSKDKYKPTRDLTHEHLAELGVKDLGPYVYLPAKKEFKLEPLVTTHVEYERLALDTTDIALESLTFAVDTGAKVPLKQARIDAAVKLCGPFRAAIKLAKDQRDARVASIDKHDSGNTPRAFSSVVDEDSMGSAKGAHIVARHVISSGSDMKSSTEVALRAAFNMLGGVVSGMPAPVSTAFSGVSEANSLIKGAIDGKFATNWATGHDYKAQLIAAQSLAPAVVGDAPGSGVVAYKTTNSGGSPLPLADVPIYLGLDSKHKGVRPLWKGDSRWTSWWSTTPKERTDWENVHGTSTLPDPLTTDIVGSLQGLNVRIVGCDDPAAHGWVVHSAYPTE